MSDQPRYRATDYQFSWLKPDGSIGVSDKPPEGEVSPAVKNAIRAIFGLPPEKAKIARIDKIGRY